MEKTNNINSFLKKSLFSDLKYEFENKTFKDKVEEISSIVDEDSFVYFQNCIFERSVLFRNIKADHLSFIDCEFYNDVTIESLEAVHVLIADCKFDKRLIVHSNDVSDTLKIESCNFQEPVILLGNYKALLIWSVKAEHVNVIGVNSEPSQKWSKIEFILDNDIKKLEIESDSTYSEIIFRHEGKYEYISLKGTFNGPILYEGKIVVNQLFLESSIFNDRIDILQGEFEYIHFSRNSFFGLVWINGYTIIEKEKKNLQIEDMTIHSNSFERGISISFHKLNYLNLSDNDFKKSLKINSQINDDKLKSDIRLSFDGINQGNIFVEEVKLNLDLNGINFGNIYFKDVVFSDLYIVDFYNKGHVSFLNILLGDRFTIQDSTVGNLEFLNTDINGFSEIVIADSNIENINFSSYPDKIRSYSSNPKVGFGIRDKSRNTENLKNVYNQLKQIARKKGDIDVANKYQSLEYKKLLLDKKLGFDKLLLFLNWASNNNGRSWSRGILFTLITALLFFNLYAHYLQIDYELERYLENYVLFITSYPKLEISKYEEFNDTWRISLIIWLARIFISYGIYQTIAAFRKFSKN